METIFGRDVIMNNELRINQLQQAYMELDSNIKKNHSFYLSDKNCLKMRQEQRLVLKRIEELESSED